MWMNYSYAFQSGIRPLPPLDVPLHVHCVVFGRVGDAAGDALHTCGMFYLT